MSLYWLLHRQPPPPPMADTLSFDDTTQHGSAVSPCWLVRAVQAARPLAQPELVVLPEQAGRQRAAVDGDQLPGPSAALV